MTEAEELIPAATVILVRDQGAGIETLMLRRNSKIAFGGAWVFPGGRVEDEDRSDAMERFGDGEELSAARVAAEREALEETGLVVSADAFEAWAYWVPPTMSAIKTAGPRRRFSTWFFVASAPEGEVTVDGGEIHEHQWLSPTEALDQQKEGTIELVPPTWVTLTQLSTFGSVSELLAGAQHREVLEFHTEPLGGKPPILTWKGDAEHSAPGGGRHRIILDKAGWVYECDF